MGRKRQHDKHLPRRMQESHGAYYHVTYTEGRKVWNPLGKDYGVALRKWAELEGASGIMLRTMQHIMGRYLKEEATKRRASTLKGYTFSVKRLLPVFGKMLPEDIDPSHIREYLDLHGNVASNRDMAMLSDCYRWANEMGLLPRDHRGYNPCRGVRKNPERARERYITHAEYWRLLRHAGTPQMRCIIALAYHTGLRQGDVLALRRSDLGPVGVTVKAGKTRKSNIFEWTPALSKLVERIKALPRTIGTTYLFAGRKGQPYTGEGFRAMWRRVKLRAGLPDVQFKDLRKKAGSDVTEAHAVSLLQHGSAKVTRKHYRMLPERIKPVR